MNPTKSVVMLGTSFDACGGIAAVVTAYRAAGLFQRQPLVYLVTHCEGGRGRKLRCCVVAWCHFLAMLWRAEVALVHLHVAGDASFWRKLLFLIPAWLFGVPTLLHLHAGAFPQFYAARHRAAQWLVRYVFDHVDCVIAVSAALQAWVRQVSRNGQVRLMPNPVALPAPVAFGRRAAAHILFLGRLGAAKGSFDLLRAVQPLAQRYPNLRLQLGGDGEVAAVRALAQQLGLAQQVDLLGWVSGAEKTRLMQRATLLVLPSYAEGQPICLLEAMAAGLAVLATRVGGVPELVSDGVEGALVAPGDVAALTAALERLLAQPALRRRMGAAGRAKVAQQYASARVLPQLEALYRELAGATLAAPGREEAA